MTEEVLGSTPNPTPSPTPQVPPSAPKGDDSLGVLSPQPKGQDADGFDWRAAASGGDAKKLAALQRFKDLNTYTEAFFNAQEKIRKGVPSMPGEGASPEEIAAYRQSAGIPEDPSAYEFPGEFADNEKPVIDGLKAVAHEAGFMPSQVQALAKWYDAFRTEVVQKQSETNAEAVRELRNSLIEEMGPRDYERNVTLAEQFLADKGALDLARMRLDDGLKLGAHPGFVKLVMSLARDYSSDDLVAAVEAPNSKSVDARLDEIYGLMKTDRAKYESDSIQAELLRLEGIKATRASRKVA